MSRTWSGWLVRIVGVALLACTDGITRPSTPHLAFIVQPSNATAGVAIDPVVAVAIQDASGEVVTSATNVVTIEPRDGTGTMRSAVSVAAVNGVATFSDLRLVTARTGYTLTAVATGLTPATSMEFAITAAPVARLVFTVQPSNTLGRAVITPPVQVAAQDSFGNLSTEFQDGVTIALGGNPGVATLAGTKVVGAVNGIATFNDLSIAQSNAAYTLIASAGPLTSAPSVIFTVNKPPVTLQVSTTTTGASFDADGYRVCVDAVPDPWDFGYTCTTQSAIGVNSNVAIPLGQGTHDIGLDEVAANCTVGETTTIEAGDTTYITFAVVCIAAGGIHVIAATTGIDRDPSYGVCIASSEPQCDTWAAVGPNTGVTLAAILAGPKTVTLTDVDANCTVSGASTRSVTVPQDGTVDVAFAVGCGLAERIAFAYDGKIVVTRVDGAESQQVIPGFAPAWSPDGTALAYECGQDICAINPGETIVGRLTVDGAGNHHPSWSPDGSKIAFAATHAGATNLYVTAANGSGGARRLMQNMGFIGNPSWSPDGAKIAFDCQVDAGNSDVCSVNADGTGFTRLTSDPARDYGAAWKPDGATLAFVTTRYGSDEIVLLDATSGGVTRIGVGLYGFAPTWSPDGSQLAYVRVSGGGDCDDWCPVYRAVYVTTADGDSVRYLSVGDQPAWKPHP